MLTELLNQDPIQIVSTIVCTWLGMRAVVGPAQPRRVTLAEVRETMARAKARRER